MRVIKRDNTEEEFDPIKIENVIYKANSRVEEELYAPVEDIVQSIIDALDDVDYDLHIDTIHREVENALMDYGLHDTAREYITYRERNKKNLFKPRTNLRPYEYPQLVAYKDAIRASYWTHTEFDYDKDVQDMLVTMSEEDVGMAKRAMLSIAQIEVAVKAFWGQVHQHIPKPEVADVGATFAESEVRHSDAYAALLELMGLQDEFKELENVPAMASRIKYLNEVNKKKDSDDPKEYFEAIILFSTFVEYVSLFSQFYVLMDMNRRNNVLSGISNAISATSKEEELHGRFGFDLINIIKEENPEWWTPEIQGRILEVVHEAFKSEMYIIDWIYGGEAPYYLRSFIGHRINTSLESIGIPPYIDDLTGREEWEWFMVEMSTTSLPDFFSKRVTNYSKRQAPITAESIF